MPGLVGEGKLRWDGGAGGVGGGGGAELGASRKFHFSKYFV